MNQTDIKISEPAKRLTPFAAIAIIVGIVVGSALAHKIKEQQLKTTSIFIYTAFVFLTFICSPFSIQNN